MNKVQIKIKRINYRYVEILEDFTFNGETVPKGFVTDYASIPRIFWVFLAPTDTGIYLSSIVHDYQYSFGTKNRKTKDLIFLRNMKLEGLSLIKRYIAYYSVRLFGKTNYNKKYSKI